MGTPLGVILQFGADSTGAQQDVEKLQQKIAGMSSESAANIEKFSKRGIAAYEELQREYIRLGSHTANLRASLSENEAAQARLNQVISAGGSDAVQATADLQRLQAEHDRLNTSLRASRSEFRAVSQASSAMMRENSLARENARSLAATFGVQLPESIGHFITQSSLAQNALASMFNVTIIAAFAGAIVELGARVYEFAEKSIDEYEGVAEAEREMKKAGGENFKQLDEEAAKSSTYAQQQLLLINQQIGAQQKLVDAQFKSLDNGVKYTGLLGIELNKLTGRQAEYVRNETGLKALLAERDKLIKILGEDEDDEKKKAEDAAKKAAEAAQKEAELQQKVYEAIHSTKVELPSFITEIDRTTAAIEKQAHGWHDSLDILKSYQEIAKEMAATPAQLGFVTPSGQGVISTQIQMVGELTAAQRALLPSEHELQLANAELERDYPQLTAAERAEWAQILLTSDAYRQHIDSAKTVKASNADLGASFRALAQQTRTAFSQMAGELTGWGGVGTRVFDQMFNAIERQIEIQQREVQEHQISQISMTNATLSAVKQLAIVKAVEEAAKGFGALGDLNFWSATQHFASAALWGTVGAFQIASMAGAFSGGGGSSKAVSGVAAAAASGSGSSSAAPTLASGAQSAETSKQNQQHTIQVIFNGDVYGAGGMKEVISKINAEVKFNRVQLFASHAINGNSLR